MSIRQTAKFLLKIFLTGAFVLIGLEVTMIVLDPYLFKGFFEYDRDLGFRVRPHSPNPASPGTQTNQFGFNASDYSLTKTAGTFRILVVGDSVNWAGGRDSIYTALLERMFEERDGGHKVDVINAGYPMTHTGEELAMLKKYGLRYQPDLVILTFCAGNDFFEADPDRKRIVVNGLYIDISRSKEHTILGYPLLPQWRFRTFIQQKYKAYAERKKAAKERQEHEEEGTFSEETYLGIERTRLAFFDASASRSKQLQANVDYIFRCISEMDALLRSRNIKLLVAICPDEFQVNERVTKAVFERFQLRPEDYDLDFAQNLLKSFLKTKDIPFIDFLDRFREEARKRDLYRPRDTHLNSAGNQLVADILFEDLAKRF
jgi:lysophospholipase L1-like esterase